MRFVSKHFYLFVMFLSDIFISCTPLTQPTTVKKTDYYPLYKGYNATYYEIDSTVYGWYDSALGTSRDSVVFSVDTAVATIDSTYYSAPDTVFVWKLLTPRKMTITIDSVYKTYIVNPPKKIISRDNNVFFKSMIAGDTSNYKQAQHSYQDGDQWSWYYYFIGTHTTFRAEYSGLVTVKAGTFDSCFSTISSSTPNLFMSNDSSIDTTIYAPNVGIIRDAFHTKNGGYNILELLTFTAK